MPRANPKTREKARSLFLSSQADSNAEIAKHLKVKPHTIAAWRKAEGWDELRIAVDRRAAEKLVEEIATDRVALNQRHYKFWELTLARTAEILKGDQVKDLRALEKMTAILDRAQKGQRLAKGLAVDGHTEEAIRAQAQAENRALIDLFLSAVKEHVKDDDARERIALSILARIPEEQAPRDHEPGH
jgi:Putative ATPase subunit of terminase (gpP-like)